MADIIKTIEGNNFSSIYVVGDLHGCYSLLMNDLKKRNFGGVSKSMLKLNEAIIDIKEG